MPHNEQFVYKVQWLHRISISRIAFIHCYTVTRSHRNRCRHVAWQLQAVDCLTVASSIERQKQLLSCTQIIRLLNS